MSETTAFRIREAAWEDQEAIREIYNEAVLNLTATYDYEPRSKEAQAAWFRDKVANGFPVLVAEGTDMVTRDGVVAFPTAVVINGEGRVAAVAVGGRSEGELRELVGKAKK